MEKRVTKSFPRLRGKRVPMAVMFSLMSSAVLFAQQWVDVTDAYIVNADYSTGTTEGWTDGTATPTVDATWFNAEYYVKKATAAQNLIGLVPGDYKLTVRGFQRTGGNDGGAAYNAGTEVISAYLFAGENQVPLQSLYSVPANPEGVSGLLNGYVNNRQGVCEYMTLYPEGYDNEVTFSVAAPGDTVQIGIDVQTNAGGSWTCWDDFHLYVDGVYPAFSARLSGLTAGRDSLATMGFAAAETVTSVIDQYAGYTESTPAEDLEAASAVLQESMESVNAILSDGTVLVDSIAIAEGVYEKMTSGTYVVPEASKTALNDAITAAKAVLPETDLEALIASIPGATEALNAAVGKANTAIGLSYPLMTAKALADKIGGLESNEAYTKVVADMTDAALTYDQMAADVAALNALCRENLSEDLLGTATDDNPIELTSFITNPNIYQPGDTYQNMPPGWLLGNKGSADNNDYTNEGYADSDFRAYSWSGNAANNIANIHYYQKIEETAEGGIALPDGMYELRAATYANADSGKIVLYATSDSVNFFTTAFNRDRAVYDAARDELGTTTTVADIVVSGGKLYFGCRGANPGDIQGGNGRVWNADNFRLYFIGADVMAAYRLRLEERLKRGYELSDSLLNYGIDPADYAKALAEYAEAMEDMGLEDIQGAISEVEVWNNDADSVITRYLAVVPLLTSGNNLREQLYNNQIFAQPLARQTFETDLEEAAVALDAMDWDTFIDPEVTKVGDALQSAITDLLESVAVCYSMGTARVLADQIGGLAETEAYQTVTKLLQSDMLDPIDVDMAVAALQGACLEAMTPEVLARATKDEPFNMTTFITNANIYQDAVDVNGQPTDREINGWICETNADGGNVTNAKEGDTWLHCGSWSGHEGHNIASATNYRQVVGTQIDEEGKFALPVGAYRVEAATYATAGANLLALYAQTNSVTTSTVPDIMGQDSTVYTYTEIEMVDSAFNGNIDIWEAAQSSLGTITIVPEIYVDNGAVTIGIHGRGVVGGNGQHWWADNFRLYYVGQNKGDNIGGTISDKSAVESEIVDVYDITGMLVRKQVNRADAMKGLKKGIYIVGGKKYVVAGN